MTYRRGIAGRDQGISAFSAILGRLCDGTRATAVALVDDEGETVDYTGSIVPYAVKVMAAELAIIIHRLHSSRAPALAAVTQLAVRGTRSSYFIQCLGVEYALVIELPRRAFRVSPRALAECVREICVEGRIPVPAPFVAERWARVEVQEQARSRRPGSVWLNGKWCPIEVLGSWVSHDLTRREFGYRARVVSGEEFTLVREARGLWFIDDSSQLGSLR